MTVGWKTAVKRKVLRGWVTRFKKTNGKAHHVDRHTIEGEAHFQNCYSNVK